MAKERVTVRFLNTAGESLFTASKFGRRRESDAEDLLELLFREFGKVGIRDQPGIVVLLPHVVGTPQVGYVHRVKRCFRDLGYRIQDIPGR